VGIDASESALAREVHAGRLTEDSLAEILGHAFFSHVDNLDLSAARVRNVEIVSAERFANLRVLVLDNKSVRQTDALTRGVGFLCAPLVCCSESVCSRLGVVGCCCFLPFVVYLFVLLHFFAFPSLAA